MSDTKEKEWLNSITAHYKWPEPSADLKQKILTQVKPRKQKTRARYVALFTDTFAMNWQPATAFASAFIFGIMVGGFTLSQSTHEAQAHIYQDADYTFMQSTLIQHQKGQNHDEQ